MLSLPFLLTKLLKADLSILEPWFLRWYCPKLISILLYNYWYYFNCVAVNYIAGN